MLLNISITKWIDSLTANSERPNRISPPAFRYQLTELARKAKNASYYLKVMNLIPLKPRLFVLNVVSQPVYC